MGWFENRRKKRVDTIYRALEGPAATGTAILDGDEGASTPVEDAVLGKLARLHPFSPVAISLLQRFNTEDVSMQEIAKLIQSDPALAAETLAYVNSPLFALQGSVTKLDQAVVILGADNTKRLATTLAMRGMLKSAPRPAVTRRLWRHSIATAVIAAELAPIYGLGPDLANTAGVLHDIGRVGLLAKDGKEFADLVLKMHDNVDAILLAEREACGMDHCASGMYLCRMWALPAVFQEVAARHHKARGATDIAGLIHVACTMADDTTFAAISHRDVLPPEERVADCVPEQLRESVRPLCADLEKRITDKVAELEF